MTYGTEGNSDASFYFTAINETEEVEMNKILLSTIIVNGEDIVVTIFELRCTSDLCTEHYFNSSILTGQLDWLFN